MSVFKNTNPRRHFLFQFLQMDDKNGIENKYLTAKRFEKKKKKTNHKIISDRCDIIASIPFSLRKKNIILSFVEDQTTNSNKEKKILLVRNNSKGILFL